MRGSARRMVAVIAAVATACGIMMAGAVGTRDAADAADMSGFRAGAITVIQATLVKTSAQER